MTSSTSSGERCGRAEAGDGDAIGGGRLGLGLLLRLWGIACCGGSREPWTFGVCGVVQGAAKVYGIVLVIIYATLVQ